MLRLMVYDRTCQGYGLLPGLTASWRAGAWLYRALGRLDAWYGASSWPEALSWLAEIRREHPIQEIQYWGHGRWGRALIDRQPLDVDALTPGHPLHEGLVAVRERMLGNGRSLLWFRTCETLGTEEGHDFAIRFSDFFDCRVAGHTYVIGPWQSGLHELQPGQRPDWSPTEGMPEGYQPGDPLPEKALWSGPRVPRTITCLHGRIPDRFKG